MSSVTAGSLALHRIGKSTALFARVYHGDGDRFTLAFKGVLARLPPAVFRIIFRHWHPISPSSPIILVEPRVILSYDGQNTAIGTSENSGHRLRFAGPAITAMPDELLGSLIAHELGHVHQMAEMAFGLLPPDEIAAYAGAADNQHSLVEQLERFADIRMSRWGYNPSALRLWANAFLADAR